MQVLLINPNWKGLVSRQGGLINRRWPPLDVLNCAALLEQNNISAEIMDLRAKHLPLETVKAKIKTADLIFITSTPLDRWQCPNLEIADFISFVNALGYKDKIYLWGAHATLNPEEILKTTKVKGVITGEPEFAVLSICKNRSGSNIIGPIEVVLDQLPIPAYNKIDLNNYYYELMGRNFALIETARGCPFQCSFCLKAMYGDKVKKKNVQKVKKEIDYIAKERGAKNIYFFDLEFTLERSRTIEIAEHIIQKKYRFNWCCQTRADAVDRDLLTLMRRSGCILIHYGIESGSQRILDAIQKKIDTDQIRKGLEMTRQAGIQSAGFFMLGFPDETGPEMEKTIAFAKELNPDYASFHPVLPYPGTPLIARTGTSDQKFQQFIANKVKRAYFSFYLRPARIITTLLRPKQLLNQLKLFYNFIK